MSRSCCAIWRTAVKMAKCLKYSIQTLQRLSKNLAITSHKNHAINLQLIRHCSSVKGNDQSSFIKRTHHCGELRSSHVGQDVILYGWVQYQRMSGQFITVRDSYGVTQILVSELQNPDLKQIVSHISAESVVKVKGTVIKRPPGQENKKMDTGDIEIRAHDVKILNTCRKDMPFHIQDFHKVKESLRMEHRYLDLRNTELQRNLRLRSDMMLKMRHYLCNMNGFVDIETPTLFRRTPGGAREFIVPTHRAGQFFCLPQSPQQFKQLLMVGGIDRYMQIARCYRDEQSKPDRQPEFTQLDLELSFASQLDIRNLIEGLLEYVWPDHLPQLTLPLPRMTYADAISTYGSDKPDTRFDKKLQDSTPLLTNIVHNPDLYWLAKAVAHYPQTSVQAINFTGAAKSLHNKHLKDLSQVAKLFVRDMEEKPWHAIIKVNADGEWQGTLAKHLGFDLNNRVNLHLNLQEGDLLLLSAGQHTPACTLLGRLRVEIASMLTELGEDVYGDDSKMNFLWVEDFPLFLPKEDGSQGYESAHHPFTAPHKDDSFLLRTQPEVARGQHYDLVLNGSEIGGGSIRIHNAELQRYVLEEILKEDVSSMKHLLDALTCGCPPHGGIALGLDRFFATLCGSKSIRDVIAFPKSSKGEDLMSKAPAPISESDAEYYCIRPVEQDSD